jgi:predicted phage-related endonuclease
MTVVQLPTRFTIGGSEAAAAAGIDPHRSRVGLWLEKTGRVEREETEAMRWGKLLEPVIVCALSDRDIYASDLTDPFLDERFKSRRGSSLMELCDPDRPWLIGHPDNLWMGDDHEVIGLIEVKTVGQWAKREWNGQPPLAYVAQCQHYLHLTGLDRALLAVLVGGQRLELTEIERNDRWIATLIELEEEFLERYLKPDLPPPVRHDDGDNLARMFPEHEPGRKVRLAKDALDVLAELRARTAQKDAIERQCEELRNQLKATMGDAETAIDAHDNEVVHWRSVTTERVDVKRLRAKRPEIAKEFVMVTQSRRFQPV